jgi:hypothetical protein
MDLEPGEIPFRINCPIQLFEIVSFCHPRISSTGSECPFQLKYRFFAEGKVQEFRLAPAAPLKFFYF